jgi:excisionase family DNA binding protein
VAESNWLTAAEAARLLGIDARTVRNAAAAGDVPVRRLGTRLLIPRDWVTGEAAKPAQLSNGLDAYLVTLEEIAIAADSAARDAATAAAQVRAVIRQVRRGENGTS